MSTELEALAHGLRKIEAASKPAIVTTSEAGRMRAEIQALQDAIGEALWWLEPHEPHRPNPKTAAAVLRHAAERGKS